MPKPVILLVDDEPHVLNAVDRDLRRQYGRNYQIAKTHSGEEALQLVQQLKQRGAMIALFLVDQRMPGMTGTEFLVEARKLYPDACKVLLTAYADTQAAINSINQIGLDYYLIKPWDPPEELLYPILDDLLADWESNAEPAYEGIRVAGTLWSPRSHLVKDFLARNQIPYKWLDIENEPEARALVEKVAGDVQRLPVIFLPNGEYLVDPEALVLAEKVGLQTEASQPFYDLVIVGGGPAGLAAGVYAGSEGLRTVIVEREATGGQAGTSARIENYLGFPRGLSGADLARRAASQAKRFGVEILTTQEVVGLRIEDPYRYVQLANGTELACHCVLIATGVSVRRLNAPGVEELTDSGIYYGAAVSEAAHYRNQEVVVVGGANSAGQGAVFLARYARSVTMLVRGVSLVASMSSYLIRQIEETPNIDLCFQREVIEVHGNRRLEGVTTKNLATGEIETRPAAAMFIFIGAVPRTQMLEGKLQLDPAGFIITGPDLSVDGKRPPGWRLKRDPYLLETSIPGVFAAGDVRHHSVKRVASAVGEGAVTVQFVHQYLKTV